MPAKQVFYNAISCFRNAKRSRRLPPRQAVDQETNRDGTRNKTNTPERRDAEAQQAEIKAKQKFKKNLWESTRNNSALGKHQDVAFF